MTAKELAAMIGVSQATVSLVINGKPGISEKTRSHVISELRRLGYGDMIRSRQTAPAEQPENTTAQTLGFVLYRNEGKMLGLNSFYPLFLDAVENTARGCGYNLVIINIDRAHANQQIQYITDAGCIGYVIFATEMQEKDLTPFEKLGLPFVLMDNYFIDKEINSVTVNNVQGCYLAVEHLLKMGHTKIGYLSSGLDITSFKERRAFSREMLQLQGIQEMEIYTIGYPIDEACEGMKQLIASNKIKKMPTAFLADNDLVAIGAMQACKELGYKIPDDISFVGNADRPISSLVEPKLTTIGVPHDRFGSEAVMQLIRQLEGERGTYIWVNVNGQLIIRSSVKDLNHKEK